MIKINWSSIKANSTSQNGNPSWPFINIRGHVTFSFLNINVWM